MFDRKVKIATWRDAEVSAAKHMRQKLGMRDARVTSGVSDGGIDVVSKRAVAQVKLHAKKTGAPDIQRLAGVAAGRRMKRIFYSASGYTPKAFAAADAAKIALFTYDLTARFRPENGQARRLLSSKGTAWTTSDPATKSVLRTTSSTATSHSKEARARLDADESAKANTGTAPTNVVHLSPAARRTASLDNSLRQTPARIDSRPPASTNRARSARTRFKRVAALAGFVVLGSLSIAFIGLGCASLIFNPRIPGPMWWLIMGILTAIATISATTLRRLSASCFADRNSKAGSRTDLTKDAPPPAH